MSDAAMLAMWMSRATRAIGAHDYDTAEVALANAAMWARKAHGGETTLMAADRVARERRAQERLEEALRARRAS